MNAAPFIRQPLDRGYRGEIAQYDARIAERLAEGRMLADARRPLRDKPAHELDRQKADSDETMKQVAEAEQRLVEALQDMAGAAILSLPAHLRGFFETGNFAECIVRSAAAEKAEAENEALAYEIDERRMDEEDAI